MHHTLESLARKQLKVWLSKLPESNVELFKRMYSPNNINLPIPEVVNAMKADQLDWALHQTEASLLKHGESNANIP